MLILKKMLLPYVSRFTPGCFESPLFRPANLVLALALLLVFTGSALAAKQQPSPATFQRRTVSGLLFPSSEGAKLYQQWCSTCHGDRGQGLTPEWRAEWPEGKQNCWQSKCHAGSHPPDGFSFPKNVPALIGPNTLTKFNTAQDLYAYTRATMPYWAPNLLEDAEYQAITIFLTEANYAARGLPLPVTLADNLAAASLDPTPGVLGAATPPSAPDALLQTPYFLLPCLISGCPSP